MRTLVTGATGKVGHAIAHALTQRGDEVRALVRDPARAIGLPEQWLADQELGWEPTPLDEGLRATLDG